MTRAREIPYVVTEETRRPYRIWDAKAKKHCVGRAYSNWRHAQDGALQITRWGKIGTELEVYDVRTGRLIGQYVRKPTTVWFSGVLE